VVKHTVESKWIYCRVSVVLTGWTSVLFYDGAALGIGLMDSDGLRVSQLFIRTANRRGDGAAVIQQRLHFKICIPAEA
jgi:hypothetical protein